MIGRVEIKQFQQINLEDPFFNSLKHDYREFEEWFRRKAEKEAYVIYNDEHLLDAFLHLKIENEAKMIRRLSRLYQMRNGEAGDVKSSRNRVRE